MDKNDPFLSVTYVDILFLMCRM